MKTGPLVMAFGLLAIAGAGRPLWAGESTEYRLTPGDVIEVTVTPQHAYDRTVTVQPDGKISFPVLGQLQAGGMTVAQLTDQLREGLNRDLVEPRVLVSLKELNRQAVPRVSVLGAVRNPGVFEIKEGTTVAEALASAGGPLPLADLRRVTITRSDRSFLTVDLAQAEKTGHLDRNAALLAGDLIVVPEGSLPTVLVLGEVTRPGSFEIRGETRLMDVISQAGGPTANADLRRVTLARMGVAGTQTIDLQPLLTGGNTTDPERNRVLQPGDTIVIAETDQRFYVLGRVNRPEIYPLKPNDRVLDALAKAGGAASDGDISRVVLVRRDAKGQPVPTTLDLKKMMAKGQMAGNDLLHPGDVLFVPDKKTHHSPGEIANLLLPITGIINVLRY